MAKLSSEEVKHVASLAQLTLSSEEIVKFQKQLSSILDYISELKSVATEGVEPTSQTTGLTNVFRSDETKTERALSDEEALSGRDDTVNGLFKVDATLKERADK